MSLPLEPVFSLLQDDFVVGWKNIAREDYVGSSHGYECDERAVGTTNGAGPRNMQMFVLSRDGVVVHCLPGFWHPEDLAVELRHAQVLHRLWIDDRKKGDKRKMFSRMQLSALRTHPQEMTARSGWQGFDASNEKSRLEHGPRDTFYYDENGKPGAMKPLTVLVHERMAARPFVKFKSFDTEEFIDYGRPYYDNNRGGVTFGSDGYMDSQKRMAAKRKEREERKARDKERAMRARLAEKRAARKAEKGKTKKRGGD